MLDNKFQIESFCSIKNNTISLNNTKLFEELANAPFSEFSKKAYKSLNTNYPKFFKMDNLSKLAFLAADILLKEQKLNSQKENNIALVFSNKSSSLDTDRKHQKSIQNKEEYYPSPAIFVYTLPNICLGEISIKYTLHSENSFFIFDHFKTKHLLHYANSLLATKKAEKVLCGWVDFEEDKYHAFLYLVSNLKDNSVEKRSRPHTQTEILKLYNQYI